MVIRIGSMAGQSADGLDAAAVEIGDERPRPRIRFIAHVARDHPDALRYRILAAASGAPLPAHDIATLHAALGDAYASLAREIAGRPARPPACVAIHGLTSERHPARHATLHNATDTGTSLRRAE